MRKVALVTYAGYPELSDDDRLLIPAFRQRGADALPVIWDAHVDWNRFDQVILRSCWDYHLRPVEFLQWIEDLERLRVQLYNSARLVRWNADKRYLRQLQDVGVQIPPTVWIDDGEEADVQGILKANGWDSAVLKPTVSASAYLCRRILPGERAYRVQGPALMQQFLPEVGSNGEWSLVFIGGEFSHSVLKTPAPGEFRVQSQFGGTVAVPNPTANLIDTASRIIDDLPDLPLYARVDGIERGDEFLLMGVELIEPVLFLELGRAADLFAERVMNLPVLQADPELK